jgi:hypothetical protein
MHTTMDMMRITDTEENSLPCYAQNSFWARAKFRDQLTKAVESIVGGVRYNRKAKIGNIQSLAVC